MTMMFEVEDLAVASPATVSRCGMVFMEPVSLGTAPLVESWMKQVPPNIIARKKVARTLKDLFELLLAPSLEFLRHHCREIVPSTNNNLVASCTRILNCFFVSYADTEFKKASEDELKALEESVSSLFIFAFVWSVLATIDQDSRQKANDFLRRLLGERLAMPGERSIYDFYFSKEEKCYREWSHLYTAFEIEPKLSYHEIVVPTNDSTRNIYLKQMLVSQRYHVMCPGPTGTGKSQNCYQLLTKELGEEYQYIALTFSA
jgi:dynein heavy chain